MHSSIPEPEPIAQVRHDWTEDEIRAIYDLPFPELLFRAQTLHRQYHDPTKVQLCTLLSIKTGACPEDCAYCPQSARYQTEVEAEKLLDVDAVLGAARRAREGGASRFCMGAAWRKVRDNRDFDQVLDMVRGVKDLGLEGCCTLGMVTREQADRLAEEYLSIDVVEAAPSLEAYERKAILHALRETKGDKLEAAKLLTFKAAMLRDSGERCSKEAAQAKLFASTTANFCADECLQIHGGAGYTDDFHVERLFRDARITEIYEGATDIQRIVIARQLLSV